MGLQWGKQGNLLLWIIRRV